MHKGKGKRTAEGGPAPTGACAPLPRTATLPGRAAGLDAAPYRRLRPARRRLLRAPPRHRALGPFRCPVPSPPGQCRPSPPDEAALDEATDGPVPASRARWRPRRRKPRRCPGLRAPLATLASPACRPGPRCPNAPSSASSPCAVPRGRPPLPASVRWCNLQPCAPGSTVLCACHCPRSAYHDLECAFAGSFYVASSGKLFQRPKRVTLTDFSTQPPGVCRTPTTRQVPCGTLKMQDSKRGTLRTGRSCRTEPAIWWSDDKPTNKCVSHCDKHPGERGRESRGRGAPAAATRARMRRRSPNPKTPLEATAQAAARGGRLAAPASSRWGLVFPKLVPRLGLRTVISPGCEHRDSGSRWRGLVGRPLDQGQR